MKVKGSHWRRSVGVLILCLSAPLVRAEEIPRIDLNEATLSQLNDLPGIGPVIAKRILELREKSGPFKRIEDLMNIRGICEKKFLKLKDLITIKSRQQSDEIRQSPEIQKSGS